MTAVPPADVNREPQDLDQDYLLAEVPLPNFNLDLKDSAQEETHSSKTDGGSAYFQPKASISLGSFYGNNIAKLTVSSGNPNTVFVVIHQAQ